METVKLKYPVEISGANAGVISLRRPKVRDLEAMDRIQGDTQKSLMLIAHLAELDPDTIRELDAEDFAAISKVVAGFLGGALPE